MKNILLIIFFLTILNVSYSQDATINSIPEPEFVGQAVLINNDNKVETLESSRIKVDSDLKLFSIKTKYKSWVEIPGCCSQTIITKTSAPIKIIIKAENNNTDPTTIYQFVKFEQDKTKRKLLMSTMSMKGIKNNQDSFLIFYGKKFGTSSYLLSITIPEPGEYGLLLGSLLEADARSMMGATSNIFTFSVK